MKNKQAFILHSCIMENGQLSFLGRAAIDIKIGDTLLYEYEMIQESYVVINIIAYRHELCEISSGMTCKLIVKGKMHDFDTNTVLYSIN